MNEKIGKLVALQQVDTQIRELKEQLEAIPQEIKRLEENFKNDETSLQDIKEEVKTLRMSKKEKEIELQTKEDEIKKHHGDLNRIKSNEAYAAVLKEIEDGGKSKDEVENSLLELMEKEEQLLSDQKKKSQMIDEKRVQLNQQKKELQEKMENLNKTLQEVTAKRETMAKDISSSVLATYKRIIDGKHGTGVVPVEDGYCGGCNQILSPQQISDILQDEDLVFCRTCSRILYKEEKKENGQ